MTNYKPNYHKEYRKANKTKLAAQQKAHRLANPDSYRDSDYKRHYGISLEQYNQMFKEQNGNCAICGRNQSEFKIRLAVDHDHKTGKIRALLCRNCNLIIGNAQENADTCYKAGDYLNNHQCLSSENKSI